MPVRLPVTQVIADVAKGRAEVTDLSETGLCLEPLPGEAFEDGKFAWLELEIAGEQGEASRIRALGELCGRRAEARSYRIKYIYPRDRRRYEAFVRTLSCAS